MYEYRTVLKPVDYHEELGNEFRYWSIFKYVDDKLLWKFSIDRISDTGLEVGSIDKESGFKILVLFDISYYVHDLIWFYHFPGGVSNEKHIEHINGDILDNRISNLKLVQD